LNEIFSSRFQPCRKPSRCKINQLPSVAETELQNQRQRVEAEGYFDIQNLEDARRRVMTSIVQRQGQSEFRQKLLDAYDRKCAITDCDVETAIEAAHIIPYQGATTNYLANGLPLRADVHECIPLLQMGINAQMSTSAK
jgi:predicted restriction endonuclease